MGQVNKITLVGDVVRLVFTLDALPAEEERAYLRACIISNPRVTKVLDCVIPPDSLEVSVIIEGYLWAFPPRLKGKCRDVLERVKNDSSCLSEIPEIPDPSA